LKPGDRIHVASLGPGIIREVRNAGRYLVELKGRSLVVFATQIQLVEPKKPKRARQQNGPSALKVEATPDGELSRVASIDLHGKTTLEAVEAVDAFLNDVLIDGGRVAHIIHGRSGGRLKAAVHQRLKQLTAVRAFRVDPLNAGVTIVTL
jgi:DNA mismatch repair protein MutS2